MTTFRIIIAILALTGMHLLGYQMDKNKAANTTFNALCVGGIAVCGIILGLCLGLLLG